MSRRWAVRQIFLNTVEPALIAFLCALMVLPPALMGQSTVTTAATGQTQIPFGNDNQKSKSNNGGNGRNKSNSKDKSDNSSNSRGQHRLSAQQKDLHALNRLTFGPRPGDEALLRRVGLEAWFQMELHPERIDDSAFDRQMQAFPAMQLSTAELLRHFPSPQMLRRAAKAEDYGQTSGQTNDAESDPAERAIYADAEFAYQQRLIKQPASPTGESAVSPGGSASVAPVVRPAAMDFAAVDRILALPPAARYAQLLALSPQQAMSLREARPAPASLLQGLSPQQAEVIEALQGPARVVGAEALETRLLRDVASQRQLQAVMTDFWLNHFSVYARKNQNEVYLLPAYESQAILPNALGTFENLLIATAESPAMLMYLDNWQSIGPDSRAAQRVEAPVANGKKAPKRANGINENYARELMELHTLGVGGGYTQQDVIEVAKCFTGWTIQTGQNLPNGNLSGFVFNPNRHEPGAKLVLGHTIPEGGMNEGLEVLHILATSPATAHFISQQLAVRFVSDTPPPALVDAMAATFLQTGGDIKAVLTTMFHAPQFWSPQVYRAKVKTPLEFLTSALRASNADVTGPLALVKAMNQLGMPLYGKQTPDGYAWTAEDWVSSNALIARMNFALVLSSGRIAGTRIEWPALLGTAPSPAADSTSAGVDLRENEQHLETLLLGQLASDRTRDAVLTEANNPRTLSDAQQNFARQARSNRPASTAPAEATPDASSPDELAAANTSSGGAFRTAGLKGAGDRRRGPQQVSVAGTPLATMAGLLLGSPEFQRR